MFNADEKKFNPVENSDKNQFKSEEQLKPLLILSRFHNCFLYQYSVCVAMSHLHIDTRTVTLNKT